MDQTVVTVDQEAMVSGFSCNNGVFKNQFFKGGNGPNGPDGSDGPSGLYLMFFLHTVVTKI